MTSLFGTTPPPPPVTQSHYFQVPPPGGVSDDVIKVQPLMTLKIFKQKKISLKKYFKKISTEKEAATMSSASYPPEICLAGGLSSRFAHLIAIASLACFFAHLPYITHTFLLFWY